MSSAAASQVLFDAVLFDLDGTLVATERFWVEAARCGARRAFAELGLERELPSPEQWLSMVGLPLAEGFAAVFGDLDAAQRALVLARCVEEGERALAAGGAALIGGARELLEDLAARGVKLGIASNCGQGYLDAMLSGLGLAGPVSEARCLDSPGVRDKAGMIASLLEAFGTRSAVMVGDRRGDAEAAHENGLPHVHVAGPIRPPGEEIVCEARVASLESLLGELSLRAEGIERALAHLGALPPLGLRTLGVTGAPLSGKTLLARDLAHVLERHGRPARVVSLDAWSQGSEPGAAPSGDPLASGFDLEGLIATELAPQPGGGPVLIVEGPYLLHPRLRSYLERVVYLSVPEEVSISRAASRAGTEGATEALLQLRRGLLPLHQAFEAVHTPATLADLLLDGSNPLDPCPAAPAFRSDSC